MYYSNKVMSWCSFLQIVSRICKPRGCLKTRADYSLYLLSPSNRVRRFCKWLSTRKAFDYFILVLIGLNCIALAVERPSIPRDSLVRSTSILILQKGKTHCRTGMRYVRSFNFRHPNEFLVSQNKLVASRYQRRHNIKNSLLIMLQYQSSQCIIIVQAIAYSCFIN